MPSQFVVNMIISIPACPSRRTIMATEIWLPIVWEMCSSHKSMTPAAANLLANVWLNAITLFTCQRPHIKPNAHIFAHAHCTPPATISAFVSNVYVVYRVPHTNRQHLALIPATTRVLNYLCVIICTRLSFGELSFTLELNTFGATWARCNSSLNL